MARCGIGWACEDGVQRFVRVEKRGGRVVATAAGPRLMDRPGRLVAAERDAVLTQNYFVPASVGSRLPSLLAILARDSESPRPRAFQACELAEPRDRPEQRHIGLFVVERSELAGRFAHPAGEGRLEDVVAWPSALLALVERCASGPRRGLELAIEVSESRRFSAVLMRDGAPLIFHEGWLERPEPQGRGQAEDALDLVEDSIYRKPTARSFTEPSRGMFRDAEDWRRRTAAPAEVPSSPGELSASIPFLIVEAEEPEPLDEAALDPFELSGDAMLRIDKELVAQSLERQDLLAEEPAAEAPSPSASADDLGWSELMDLADRSGEIDRVLDPESAAVFDAMRLVLSCAEDVLFEELGAPERVFLFGEWRAIGVDVSGLSALSGAEVEGCTVGPLLEGAGLPPGSEPESYAMACGLALKAAEPGAVLGGLRLTPLADRVRSRAQKLYFALGLALCLTAIAYGALTDRLALQRREADAAVLAARTRSDYREKAQAQAGIKKGLLKSRAGLLAIARASRASKRFPDTLARLLAALPVSVQPIFLEAKAPRDQNDPTLARVARFAPQPPTAIKLEAVIRVEDGEGEPVQRWLASRERLKATLSEALESWELVFDQASPVSLTPLVYRFEATLRQAGKAGRAAPAVIGGAR